MYLLLYKCYTVIREHYTDTCSYLHYAIVKIKTRTYNTFLYLDILVCKHTWYMRTQVDSNRIVTTFAGSGSTGSTGDGVPATSAVLDYPRGVSVDALGNVYVAVGKIRKVSTDTCLFNANMHMCIHVLSYTYTPMNAIITTF